MSVEWKPCAMPGALRGELADLVLVVYPATLEDSWRWRISRNHYTEDEGRMPGGTAVAPPTLLLPLVETIASMLDLAAAALQRAQAEPPSPTPEP
jgi:hypothetical protein